MFGGGTRTISFTKDPAVKDAQMKVAGKTCNIRVPQGLPNTTSTLLKNCCGRV